MRTNSRSRVQLRRGARAAGILWFVNLPILACSRTNDHAELKLSIGKPAARLDSVAVRSAELALKHFLDASREGSMTHDSLAALTACDEAAGTSYFPTSLLAGYSILPSDMRGDTVLGRAAVVTVAEQDVDRRTSGAFTARQRVREDVLEWDIIPSDDNQHWTVCNGLRFGYLGADSLTVWRPDGASYQSARALVDSIVKARGN